MDHVTSVRGLECLGRLENQRDGRLDGQADGCLCQHGGEIAAAQQLHDNEELTVIGADVVHHGDPRMLQPGPDHGFAPEPCDSLRICKLLPQHLYRYRPTKPLVDPAPHVTHAPAAQRRLQGVPSGELEPSLHAGNYPSSGLTSREAA